jgi:hypothetical protein
MHDARETQGTMTDDGKGYERSDVYGPMVVVDGRRPTYLNEVRVGSDEDGRKIFPSHFRRGKTGPDI